jgi:3-isopropylmalate dehydrogenase
MLLRHSLQMEVEAQALETAVGAVLEVGHRTPDLSAAGHATVTTQQMGDLVVEALLAGRDER